MSVHLVGLGMISAALNLSLSCRYVTNLQLSRPASVGVVPFFRFSLQLCDSTKLFLRSSAWTWTNSYVQFMSKPTNPTKTLPAIWLRPSTFDQIADIDLHFSSALVSNATCLQIPWDSVVVGSSALCSCWWAVVDSSSCLLSGSILVSQ